MRSKMSGEQYGRLAAGSRIGVYEVRSFLGRGATANVYECTHSTLGRVVAVKLLHPHLVCNETSLKRFLREGRALSRIVHPNVIDVLDVGQHEGAGFLVMSLALGEDLSAHIRRRQPMTLADIANMMLPVIGAVAAAHEAGIVHRDLKPSNIRMTLDARGKYVPKVLDFGISKLVQDDPNGELTESESVLGTTYYMAPEQLRSARDVDGRADVYSLGVILYECAANRRPFAGDNAYERMHAIVTAPVPPLRRWRADLPQAFEDVVFRAMSRRALDRFASARELGLALAPFASEPERWLDEFRGGFGVVVSDALAVGESRDSTTVNSFTVSSVSARRKRPARVRRAGLLAAIAASTLFMCVGLLSSRSAPLLRSSAVAPSQARAAPPSFDGQEPAPSSAQPLQTPVLQPGLPSTEAPFTPPVAIHPHQATKRTKGLPPPRAATAEPTDEMGRNGAPILE
jgi:serine/threonine-protein kinase